MYQQAVERVRQIRSEARYLEPLPRGARHLRTTELEGKIEAAVADVYGFTDHPKREMLWEKAYERGHAEGWGEIISEYDDLSELLR